MNFKQYLSALELKNPSLDDLDKPQALDAFPQTGTSMSHTMPQWNFADDGAGSIQVFGSQNAQINQTPMRRRFGPPKEDGV